MRKTALALFVFFITQTTYAAFLKPNTTDSAQSHSAVISSPYTLPAEEYTYVSHKPLSFVQKAALLLLPHKSSKRRSQWLVVVAGFFLGVTGIGYVVSLFTHNDDLRKGAKVGFRVFLTVCFIYLAALLSVLLILGILGQL